MAIISLLSTFGQELLHSFFEILYAPLIFSQILWILLPVIGAILLMEAYFSRYPRESIGHHKSLENTIFLVFVSFDLIRYVFVNPSPGIEKILLMFAFVIFAIVISLLDFFHRLPISLFMRLSSKFIVAYVSYISLVLMYSNILSPFDSLKFFASIISAILLFIALVGVKQVMALLEPKSYEEIEHFLRGIEEDIRKASEERAKPGPETASPPIEFHSRFNYSSSRETKRKSKNK